MLSEDFISAIVVKKKYLQQSRLMARDIKMFWLTM